MKKAIPALLFFLACLSCYGGIYQDSLYLVLDKKKLAEREQLSLYAVLLDKYARLDPTESIKVAERGINLAINKRDSAALGTLLRLKGTAFITKGNRDSALFYYHKGLAIFEKFQMEQKAAEAYNDIARFYRQSYPDRAIGYYDQAMKIYEKLDNAEGIATIYNESGVAFEYKGDLDEAIRRYRASLDIQKRRNDAVGVGYSLEFLSGAYLKKKEYALAEKYIFEALHIRKQTRDTFALCLNYTNIGDVYRERKKNRQAITYYQYSNRIAEQIKYLDILSYNYKQIATAYQSLEQYKEALRYLDLHNQFKDSVFTIAKNKQIEELNIKYETEQHKSTIRQQQFAISKRNYWIVSICLITLISGIMAYLFYRRYRLKQQNKLQALILVQQEEASKAILEAEEEERQRIARDLHDGIGQMMSVARMNLSAFEDSAPSWPQAQAEQLDKIKYLVDESCKEIRNVSHNMMPNSLLKKSLASAVRDFIDKIDKKALEVHLYTEGLDERIDSNIETVFYRVIQECVNNVIKHSGADRLDISIMREPAAITTTIEDNGKGFDTGSMNRFEGIGLKNITSRVNYLKGTLEIDSAPGQGTLIAIYIPT